MTESIKVGPLTFVVGEEYVRRDIHDVIGGQWQGGISTSSKYPVILLFTSDTGRDHGYGFDGWQSKDVYHYTGEGQQSSGDMKFIRGNKAIRDHIKNGRRLLLFKHVVQQRSGKRRVEFVAEMEYRNHEIKMRDSAGYGREVIVFTLAPVESRSSRAANESSAAYDDVDSTWHPWSQDEIAVVVAAYFELLGDEIAGRDVVKSHLYERLHKESLPARSAKSISLKMQNVSSVFDRHKLPFVRGLAPLSNAQTELVIAVEERLLALGWIKPDGQ